MNKTKIAVITPYYMEPIAMISECHQSVINQEVDAEVKHFLIADGHAIDQIDSWNATHIKLPHANADNGNTPRGIGSIIADNYNYDFITYLDADNWFHKDHLKSLLTIYYLNNSPIICSSRTFHSLKGEKLNFTEAEEDQHKHIDTSCYFLHRSCFDLIYMWTQMPKILGPICDRIFFAAIKWKRYSIFFSNQRTVAFRSQYAFTYKNNKDLMPEKSKTDDNLKASFDYLKSINGVSECIKKMGFYPGSYL